MTDSRPDSEKDPFLELPEASPLMPSCSVSDQIRRHCTHNLKPARPWSRGRRVQAALGLCLLVILGVVAAYTDTPNPSALHLCCSGLWFGAVALLVALGLSDARANTRLWRWLALGLGALGFYAYLEARCTSHVALSEFFGDPTWRSHALFCGSFSLAAGAAALSGMLYLWRRTDPFNPQLSGSLIGLASGIAGALAVGLKCPVTESWHLLLAHGAGVALLIGVGLLLGRRVLCP